MQTSGKLVTSAIIAALGGFLFGFDTVVISGAEQSIQVLWELSDVAHGLAMSAALWGTVLGSLTGGIPTDRFGRKPTLIGIGGLYFVSAVWSGLATDAYSFMMARFIGGVGVGVSTVAAPLYVAELSPAHLRGRLAGLFQFNLVFGILLAFVSNFLLKGFGEDAWRWMLGVEALPALIYTALAFRIPESPRWLIGLCGDREQAARVFAEIQPDASDEEIAAKVNEVAGSLDSNSPSDGSLLLVRRLSRPIQLAFLVAFFNQLSGINAVLYFAPRIFELTGLGAQAALLQSIGIGVTNLVFTMAGLALIDSWGRRTLLLIGSAGYIASLSLCSWGFFSENFGFVPPSIFAFIASHAIGQGAVIWVLISEIFPNEHRGLGNSIGCGTHWVFAALLTLCFPYVVATVAPGYIFAFFSGMMALQLVWVLACVPETKGVSLEDIQQKLGIA